MSKFLWFIPALLLIVLIFAERGLAETPELLGPSEMWLWFGDEQVYGLMWNDYAGFWLQGSTVGNRTSCTLKKVWGGDFYGWTGDPIPCELRWLDAERFQGWIEFRGHERALCGAIGQSKLPKNCRLK